MTMKNREWALPSAEPAAAQPETTPRQDNRPAPPAMPGSAMGQGRAPAAPPAGKGMFARVASTQQRADAEKIIAIDTARIDESPFADRLSDNDGEGSDLAFRENIKDRGQKTPILVRARGDRFEIVYGRRRTAACRFLGIPVRAIIVHDLDDAEAKILQISENAQRKGYSFAEKALIADSMRADGIQTPVIAKTLDVQSNTLSDYFTVVNEITRPLIQTIGRAEAYGRRPWTKLMAALRNPAYLQVAGDTMAGQGFSELDSQKRFKAVYEAVEGAVKAASSVKPQGDADKPRLSYDPKRRAMKFEDAEFGSFVAGRQQELWREFEANKTQK